MSQQRTNSSKTALCLGQLVAFVDKDHKAAKNTYKQHISVGVHPWADSAYTAS